MDWDANRRGGTGEGGQGHQPEYRAGELGRPVDGGGGGSQRVGVALHGRWPTVPVSEREGGYLGDDDEQQLQGAHCGEVRAAVGGIGSEVICNSPGDFQNSTALAQEQELAVGKLDYLLASERGGHWRLVDGQVQKWNGRLERSWPYPWTSDVNGYAACEDSQGNLVVGTWGQGIFWFDAQGNATHLSTEDGLTGNTILSLQFDREGSLWVGTDGGGLNRVKRQIFEPLEACEDLAVRSVSEDGEGGLWFSSTGVGTAAGANYLKEGVLRHYDVLRTTAWDTNNFFVRSLFVDREQRVWAGTFGGGLYQLQDGEFQPTPGIAGEQ